jgi:hypothetical protein
MKFEVIESSDVESVPLVGFRRLGHDTPEFHRAVCEFRRAAAFLRRHGATEEDVEGYIGFRISHAIAICRELMGSDPDEQRVSLLRQAGEIAIKEGVSK